MKNNGPVTNKEHTFSNHESLYSRTTPDSIIVEVNDVFERLSGFTREELYGQSHNIVRHPDMPREAFEDFWNDLQAGRTWRGMVKNRSKDGGYYWVNANVSPIRNKKREIIGYQSVRFKPTSEQIKAAELAYKRIRNGDTRLYIKHGRVIEKSLVKLMFNSPLLRWLGVCVLAGLPLLASLTNTAPTLVALVTAITLPAILGVRTFQKRNLIKTFRDWLQAFSIAGDLRAERPTVLNADAEIEALSHEVQDFASNVHVTIKGIDDISMKVADAAEQSLKRVDEIFSAIKKQNEATESSATAVEELSVSISDIYTQAEHANEAVRLAEAEAKEARVESEQASKQIDSLVEAIQSTAHKIEVLGQRSEEIGNIVSMIQSISEQTNLLALNAAIEAARAGEHGRGFAVVADEVRGLSERTSKATQEISSMINAIRGDAQQAISAMADSQEQANSSMSEVAKVADSLVAISTRMEHSMSMVNHIAQITNEQRTAVLEISKSISHVSKMSEQNLEVAKQTHTYTEGLQALSERMIESVRQYQI